MKVMILGVVATVVLATGLAQGTVYDYTAGGLNGSDWTLETSGSYWSIRYKYNMGGNFFQFVTNYTDSDNRGVFAWEKPLPGEYIQKIDFRWAYNTIPEQVTPAVFSHTPGDTDLSDDPVLYEILAGTGVRNGTQTLTFTAADNLKGISLGFEGTPYTWTGTGWVVEFGDIVITTAPEPATIGLMMTGGLLLRRRKA